MHDGIVTHELTKRYPGTKEPSLKGLNLTVRPGEIYGFLGSNGAGKSTTIRTLMNFLQATSGSAQIMGLDSVKDSVKIKQSVGYLAGDVALPNNVKGKDLLKYLASLQGIKDLSYLDELSKMFEADLDKKIGQLSKGNRQKIGIIQALMGKSKVLILDEPTSGLDPLMQDRFYKVLVEFKKQGSAILMSSHSLGEVQSVCDRAGIIKQGQLVREGTIEDFARDQKPTFTIILKEDEQAEWLNKHKAVEVVSIDGFTVKARPTGEIAPFLAILSKLSIADIEISNELQDEFMSYYQKSEEAK